MVVDLNLGGQRESATEQEICDAAEQFLPQRGHRCCLFRRGRPRFVLAVVLVLNHELRCPLVQVLVNLPPLPEHLELKHTRLALYFKDYW